MESINSKDANAGNEKDSSNRGESEISTYESFSRYVNSILKLTVLFVLICFFIGGVSLYNDIHRLIGHDGPSCNEYLNSGFEYWLRDEKGHVVSVYEDKLQTNNGTTSCHGEYAIGNGVYKTWHGFVTVLKNGNIVGKADLDN